jgi:hypothetical protein
MFLTSEPSNFVRFVLLHRGHAAGTSSTTAQPIGSKSVSVSGVLNDKLLGCVDDAGFVFRRVLLINNVPFFGWWFSAEQVRCD